MHHALLYISLPSTARLPVKMPNFTFCEGRKQAMTKFRRNCSPIGHNNTKHFLCPIRSRHLLEFLEMVRWESVPRGSFARTWKLSSRLFSWPDWLLLGLRGSHKVEPRYKESTFSHFTIIGVKKIVRYAEHFIRRGSLYRGSTVLTQRTSFRFHLSNYCYSLLSLFTGF